MFTGIITHQGLIQTITRNGTEDMRATIAPSPSFEPVIGASIACDGCCLTVVKKTPDTFTVDISAQTLSCTTLEHWKEGSTVNLEQALRVGDELGGHFVTGHVDGLAVVTAIESIESSHKVTFSAPTDLMRYMADKGSVTLSGISLTVTSIITSDSSKKASEGTSQESLLEPAPAATGFTINVIPHTWEETSLGSLAVGDNINMEIDVLARYVLKNV